MWHLRWNWAISCTRRYINTSGPLHFRQKLSYKTRYHWLLDLQKSRQRARYPWIPREPPTAVNIDDQRIEFPEMQLDFIVPANLNQCELKPYVDWRASTPNEEELTADKLFDKKYIPKIQNMYERGIDKSEIIKKVTS